MHIHIYIYIYTPEIPRIVKLVIRHVLRSRVVSERKFTLCPCVHD